MEITEQRVVSKNPRKKSEDGIVVTDDFVAVIDGSTSKSDYRHSLFNSNGRQAMLTVSRYIRKMPKSTTLQEFLTGVTAYVRRQYRRSMTERLAAHPEDRLTCSAVVFSRLCREIWMIGDCQCLVAPVPTVAGSGEPRQFTYYDNPKPAEAELAAMRAEEAHRLLSAGITPEELLLNDTARQSVISRMLETMQEQNVGYSVIDGFRIPPQHVRCITLDFRPWEIVLASDGYPFLKPTLAESELLLEEQRRNDPLNIGSAFQATKGFTPGNASFDDRSYIRFTV